MSVRVLVTDGIDKSAAEKLRAEGIEVVEKFYEPDAVGRALRDFDIVVIRSATKIKKQQIDDERGGRLKWIIRAGVGMDNIDIPYAKAAGIESKNTPRASSNAVAELAIGLMLSCARNISIAGYTMREKQWQKKAYSNGFELAGKTLGVIGYGRIGHMVGDKAQALGMKVLGYDIFKPNGCECETMHFVPLEQLIAESDIITIHTPGGEKPLINAETIARMKPGVVIINASRASNVDEAALLDALNSGRIRAAGLDVWTSEKEPNWALASHPSVTCTPHIGAGTKEAQQRIGDELVALIESFGK